MLLLSFCFVTTVIMIEKIMLFHFTEAENVLVGFLSGFCKGGEEQIGVGEF